MRPAVLVVAMLAINAAAAAQTMRDPHLAIELVANGTGTGAGVLTSAMVFLDADTALLINKGDGQVKRLDLVEGQVVTPGAVVADLDIIVGGSGQGSEYAVQGIVLDPDFATNHFVYIRYDQSPVAGRDTPQDDVVLGEHPDASIPTDNVIERYLWDENANTLTFDALIYNVVHDTRYHHGGGLLIGPDERLYTSYGDLRRTQNGGWQSQTAGALFSVNLPGGVVDDLAVIVRIELDGTPAADNPFDPDLPDVPAGTEAWYAYGVRNSWGIAFDPSSGALWATEDGENDFDEVNRIDPGFNSGFLALMGPADHPDQTGTLEDLVVLPGSAFSDPEFSWRDTIGVTAIGFGACTRLGEAYDDLVIVGNFVRGHLFGFRLNATRDGFVFDTPALQDNVDDRAVPLEDPVGPDGDEIVLGLDIGAPVQGIILIERSPDGFLYICTGAGDLYRLVLAQPADFDTSGTVDVGDLLRVLAEWGTCAGPCPCIADIDRDGLVGVNDLLLVLANWS